MKKIDKYHYHEALDRVYIINRMIDELLLEHPVIQKHNEISKLVKSANNIMLNAYQLIGALDEEMNGD